jgi:hypothetical protein
MHVAVECSDARGCALMHVAVECSDARDCGVL